MRFGIPDTNLLFRSFFLCSYRSEVAEAQQLFLWGLRSCRSTAGAKKQPFRSQPRRCFFFRHLIMLGATNKGQKGRSIYRGSRNYEYHVRALDHPFLWVSGLVRELRHQILVVHCHWPSKGQEHEFYRGRGYLAKPQCVLVAAAVRVLLSYSSIADACAPLSC